MSEKRFSIVKHRREPHQELSSHDRILLAARALFSSDGYESTTTSAIARRAGTSESQLIKHFGSKEGLLEALFNQTWQRIGPSLEQAVAQVESPTAKLRVVAELVASAFERDPELGTLMFLEGRRIRRHGHAVLLTSGFLQLVELIDHLLQTMQEAGELKPGLHLQAVRSGLIGALEGMLRDQLLARRGGYPATFNAADLRASFQAVLSGFLNR
jgi:AcrR family transcriptional regulator